MIVVDTQRFKTDWYATESFDDFIGAIHFLFFFKHELIDEKTLKTILEIGWANNTFTELCNIGIDVIIPSVIWDDDHIRRRIGLHRARQNFEEVFI